jgi:hypothetical protein
MAGAATDAAVVPHPAAASANQGGAIGVQALALVIMVFRLVAGNTGDVDFVDDAKPLGRAGPLPVGAVTRPALQAIFPIEFETFVRSLVHLDAHGMLPPAREQAAAVHNGAVVARPAHETLGGLLPRSGQAPLFQLLEYPPVSSGVAEDAVIAFSRVHPFG